MPLKTRWTLTCFWATFYTACLIGPAAQAQFISFTVIEAGRTAVRLQGTAGCSPGTLINMKRVDATGKPITLRVISRPHDNVYVAVSAFNDVDLSTIKINDTGMTESPQQATVPMKVLLSGNDHDRERMEDALKGSTVVVVDSEHVDSNTARVEIDGSGDGSLNYVLTSFMGKEEGHSASVASIREAILRCGGSLFWITLHNPLRVSFHTKMQALNSVDFNADNSLDSGKSIALHVVPSVKGFLSILMIDRGGRITVLFPNELAGVNPSIEVVPSVDYDVTALSKLDLKAADIGPTIFVAVVSSIPRPLAAFVPADRRGSFVTWNGNPLKTESIGPGWIGRDGPGYDGRELAPESWDSSTVTFNVVSRSK
jgi:microcompartment protein CcmL/EutN